MVWLFTIQSSKTCESQPSIKIWRDREVKMSGKYIYKFSWDFTSVFEFNSSIVKSVMKMFILYLYMYVACKLYQLYIHIEIKVHVVMGAVTKSILQGNRNQTYKESVRSKLILSAVISKIPLVLKFWWLFGRVELLSTCTYPLFQRTLILLCLKKWKLENWIFQV